MTSKEIAAYIRRLEDVYDYAKLVLRTNSGGSVEGLREAVAKVAKLRNENDGFTL